MAQDLMNTFAVVFLPELYQYDMREVHSCLTVNAWNASWLQMEWTIHKEGSEKPQIVLLIYKDVQNASELLDNLVFARDRICSR